MYDRRALAWIPSFDTLDKAHLPRHSHEADLAVEVVGVIVGGIEDNDDLAIGRPLLQHRDQRGFQGGRCPIQG